MEQHPAGGGFPKIILEDEAYPTDNTRLVHPRRLVAGIERRGVEGLQLFPRNSTPRLPKIIIGFTHSPAAETVRAAVCLFVLRLHGLGPLNATDHPLLPPLLHAAFEQATVAEW